MQHNAVPSAARSAPSPGSGRRLRLLAATLMRLEAGRDDEAAATEAQRRLRWWRGDPDAPMWRPM